MTTHWYALHVKPHKERLVYHQLQARDIVAYLPLYAVKPVNPRAAKERPFFPGYLFVRIDLESVGETVVQWTPGTHGLVTFGDEPAIVPDQFMRELQARISHIRAQGAMPLGGLRKGDRVRIMRGPFAGYEAVFDRQLDGTARVQVLLAFLSRHPQRLKLAADDIEKSKR
jgi:transcriptional antiterminator RfaH